MNIESGGGGSPIPDDRNLTRKELSEFLRDEFGLKYRPATLAKWFSTRSDGPPAVHFKGKPLYPAGLARQWARKQFTLPRQSSSQPAQRVA